ncbi:MAG: hypothetical protein K8F92_14850 [Hyphomicrobium sp.]|uniref:hypothetical protein n=1 Tax=Hyphomicrobium sp. TaxID=82 RepID=UPI00132C0EED|nr:hypothetical protein [Hyphomicrobium sp.]KAB2937667.1 MAG: hypothetical protein F9K20_19770 [Hyphomicrobium sp.]MBZ0210911.1 hypothetical protein [Hyphomicrobium sp.]
MRLLPVPACRAAGIVALGCACLLFAPLTARGVDAAPATNGENGPMKAVMAEYRKKLAEYNKAWDAYEKIAAPYWRAVTDRRSRRRTKMANDMRLTTADYVMTQPPIYTGPPKPENPLEPKKKPDIPDVDEFLAQAKAEFGFVPEAPADEVAFKRAYARVAAAKGLERDACVKIYGFESGGNGKYDIQAGREYDPKAKVISTALGYNQLLTTNTVGLLAEAGGEFLAALNEMAAGAEGERKARLEDKIAKLKEMIAFARTVPNEWNAHGRLANTPKGIGVHALNLDVHVGPLLQTRKLTTSVAFAKRKGYSKALTAAELEMMNLTGDGNGYDMLVMPQALREKVPTSNFFQRGGYERNPVAARNNTVAKLIAATDAKMVREAQLQGAKDLAAAFDEIASR